MADLRPALAPIYAAFGVAATVTPFGGAATSATVITGRQRQRLDAGPGDVGVLEMVQTIAVRKSEVAALPRKSTITIGESAYIVDGPDDALDDRELRVKVRAA